MAEPVYVTRAAHIFFWKSPDLQFFLENTEHEGLMDMAPKLNARVPVNREAMLQT